MLRSTGIIKPRLLATLRREFTLDWNGIHGIGHWGRVRANGLRLAGITGANARVVELFAVLHDSRRRSDGHDPAHGHRAAENAVRFDGDHYSLSQTELELLCQACTLHSDGHTEADVTVQVCWDADRLDLGRVGIEPSPAKLCSAAARDSDFIARAYRRSL